MVLLKDWQVQCAWDCPRQQFYSYSPYFQALQSAILFGNTSEKMQDLHDVITPLLCGVETAGSVTTALIERNTTVPKKYDALQQSASSAYPGIWGSACAHQATQLQEVSGIPPVPCGVPHVKVTPNIDANSILIEHMPERVSNNHPIFIFLCHLDNIAWDLTYIPPHAYLRCTAVHGGDPAWDNGFLSIMMLWKRGVSCLRDSRR